MSEGNESDEKAAAAANADEAARRKVGWFERVVAGELISQLDADLAERNQALAAATAALDEATRERSEFKSRAAQWASERERLNKRLKELEDQLAKATRNAGELTARIAELESASGADAARQKELDALNKKLQEANQLATTKETARAAAARDAQRLQTSIDLAQKTIKERDAAIESLKSELARAKVDNAKAAAQTTSNADREADMRRELERMMAEASDGAGDEALREAQAMIEELEAALVAQRRVIEERDAALAGTNAEIARLRSTGGRAADAS